MRYVIVVVACSTFVIWDGMNNDGEWFRTIAMLIARGMQKIWV